MGSIFTKLKSNLFAAGVLGLAFAAAIIYDVLSSKSVPSAPTPAAPVAAPVAAPAAGKAEAATVAKAEAPERDAESAQEESEEESKKIKDKVNKSNDAPSVGSPGKSSSKAGRKRRREKRHRPRPDDESREREEERPLPGESKREFYARHYKNHKKLQPQEHDPAVVKSVEEEQYVGDGSPTSRRLYQAMLAYKRSRERMPVCVPPPDVLAEIHRQETKDLAEADAFSDISSLASLLDDIENGVESQTNE
jgi:hypothetical protein